MRKIISQIYLILLFLFVAIGNKSFSNNNDVNFIATELLGRPTDKSVTVNAIADTDLEVFFEYGIESGIFTDQTDTTMFPAREPIEIILNQLQPNTRYYYRMRYRQLGDANFNSGAEHTFQTQRPLGSTFKFAIQTDSHLYDKKCYPALYQVTLKNVLTDTPDFLIDLGDTFGDDHDTTIDYEAMLQLNLDQRYFLDAICHSTPLFFCLGNHEGECGAYLDGSRKHSDLCHQSSKNFLPQSLF